MQNLSAGHNQTNVTSSIPRSASHSSKTGKIKRKTNALQEVLTVPTWRNSPILYRKSRLTIIAKCDPTTLLIKEKLNDQNRCSGWLHGGRHEQGGREEEEVGGREPIMIDEQDMRYSSACIYRR